jgi:flagellar biogenesis protein FliO
MFESVFGAEVSPALKFFLAFVVVIALIGVIAWLVRRFGGERFGGSTARGRQPRLAVVDAAAVDGRRRLVIIRRDNVEHLLMIGGPTDVLIEPNIVRATSPREKIEPTMGRALSSSEPLPRPVPLGETNTFPPQPTPETNGRPPRLTEEPAQWTWPAQSEPQRAERPARAEPRLDKTEKPDTLPNMTDEVSVRPPQPREPSFARPPTPPASRPAPTPPAPIAATPAAPTPADRIESTDKPAEKTFAAADPDQNLADMANMLGGAFRRNEPRLDIPAPAKSEPMVVPPPTARMTHLEPRFPPPEPRITPPEPRVIPPEPPKPARTETKPAQPETRKAVYDSLEEEMASLLGRPPGKS